MSHQIIQQRNGKFCIYDTVSDTIVDHNLKEKEILPAFIESYTEMITKEIERILHTLKTSDQSPYKGRHTSYVRALLNHVVNHATFDLDKEDPLYKAVLSEIEEYKKAPPEEFIKLVRELFPKSEWMNYNVVSVPDIPLFKKRTILPSEIPVAIELTDSIAREWSDEAQRHRRLKAKGSIISYHKDNNYYDVLHEDGTVGFYSPWELIPHE